MDRTTVVVDALMARDKHDVSLRDDAWSIALDQQAFGPGRILLAAADHAGDLLAIIHTRTTDPPDLGLAYCLEHLLGLALTPAAAAAVVFTNERVGFGPPPPDLEFHFRAAREMVKVFGLHLVDWFACDRRGELIRSTRMAIDPDSDWWTCREPGWPTKPSYTPSNLGCVPSTYAEDQHPSRRGTRRRTGRRGGASG
jgi:hypothetical protein